MIFMVDYRSFFISSIKCPYFIFFFNLTLSELNTYFGEGNKYQENHQTNDRLFWYVERAVFN